MIGSSASNAKTVPVSSVMNDQIEGISFKTLLEDTLAVVFQGIFSLEENQEIVSKIYSLKNLWVPSYEGEQYALGRVWYAHVDDRIQDNYFERAIESNKMIETHFPGLYQKLCNFCSKIQMNEPVRIREKWAGPGFVIFPAHEYCAKEGGGIHYDWEGLTEEQRNNSDTEAYSFISLLQKPERGGGIRIWETKYDPSRKEESLKPSIDILPDPGAKNVLIDYQVGDLLLINSLSLHQIQPFEGDADRITLTFHIAKNSESWHIWF
jgi:hypothetical protein